MEIRKLARAKINLCLHVVGQRSDGYHLLDSVVAFADFGDILTVSAGSELSLNITGPFGADLNSDGDNLVMVAAKLFPDAPSCHLTLEKRLPVASGIGGGSADAAATLHAFSELSHQPVPSPEACLALGADVPVCVLGRPVIMRGIGDDLEPLPTFPQLPVVLVNPGVAVSTAAVFNALETKANPPLSGQLPNQSSVQETVDWLQQQRNDLEPPAIASQPGIGAALQALKETGAQMERMSGSGATCFGIYETTEAAKAAAVTVRQRYSDWWVQDTVLCGSDDSRHDEI